LGQLKIIAGLLLVALISIGTFQYLKGKASRSDDSRLTAGSQRVSEDPAKSRMAQSTVRRKKTAARPPVEIVASTHPAASSENQDVVISTEMAEPLPSAQAEVGNDLSILQSRVELKNEVINGQGDNDTDALIVRIDGAYNRRLALRMDVPYVFDLSKGNPQAPGRGWGDVMIRGSSVLKKTSFAGFTGSCDFWFNTAEASNLGSGKNSVGPALSVNLANAYKDLMLSAFIQQKVSYSGDASRKDINRSKVEFIVDRAWKERYWMQVDATLFADWKDAGRTAADLELEAGTRLGNHWSAWIRPGVGLWGQGVSGGYNSYGQAGFRYIFGELLRKKVLDELKTQEKSLIQRTKRRPYE
jgi:hypothetical protein